VIDAVIPPMTGVTDMVVRRYGSGLNVTEMIASPAMIRETRQSLQKAAWHPVEEPVSMQLVGCSARNGRGGQAQRGQGRGDHRYQHGLPGPKKVVNGDAGSAP
jgi:tRNA-dihydrouridine synthase B